MAFAVLRPSGTSVGGVQIQFSVTTEAVPAAEPFFTTATVLSPGEVCCDLDSNQY